MACSIAFITRSRWSAVRGRGRGQSDGLHHRQPERQERGKREACIDPHSYDAGQKIKGKKRHVLVDTEGLLMHAIAHPADVQDRDGGLLLLSTLFGLFPSLAKVVADGGYLGPRFEQGAARLLTTMRVEIVKRSDAAKRLCRVAPPLGCRAHAGMAQSAPPLGQGLREPDAQCARVPKARLSAPYAAQAMKSLDDFPDGL